MPSWALSRLAGAAVLMAALGIGSGGPAALACGLDCRGYGYHPARSTSPRPSTPIPMCRTALTRPSIGSTSTTRVNIFGGPRWGYAAAYSNPRGHGGCGRHVRGCAHRAYLSGPIVRGVRAWRAGSSAASAHAGIASSG